MSDFTMGAFHGTARPSFRRMVADAALVLHEMIRARSTRRMLSEMDDRMLADIGVGRGDALEEARRPMWDLAQRRA